MSKPRKTQKELPAEGTDDAALIELMTSYKEQDEARWRSGQASGAVYHGGEKHLAVLNRA